MRLCGILAGITWAAAGLAESPARVFNEVSHGAPSDGKVLATMGINKAIDAANHAGRTDLCETGRAGVLDDVNGAKFNLVKAQHAAGVVCFTAAGCPITRLAMVTRKEL